MVFDLLVTDERFEATGKSLRVELIWSTLFPLDFDSDGRPVSTDFKVAPAGLRRDGSSALVLPKSPDA